MKLIIRQLNNVTMPKSCFSSRRKHYGVFCTFILMSSSIGDSGLIFLNFYCRNGTNMGMKEMLRSIKEQRKTKGKIF